MSRCKNFFPYKNAGKKSDPQKSLFISQIKKRIFFSRNFFFLLWKFFALKIPPKKGIKRAKNAQKGPKIKDFEGKFWDFQNFQNFQSQKKKILAKKKIFFLFSLLLLGHWQDRLGVRKRVYTYLYAQHIPTCLSAFSISFILFLGFSKR